MFIKAKPVWIDGKELEKNIQAKFTAEFTAEKDAVLKITGATFFKVFLNGKLIHYGPSPTARGYARIDVVKLENLVSGTNTITVEAAGYNCYCFAAIKQTSFIQAEVVCGDTCVAATGFDFKGFLVASRKQKVMRYSYQRHFTEIWDLHKSDEEEKVKVLDLDIKYLPRRAPLPDIEVETMASAYSKDKYEVVDKNWPIPSLQGAIDKPSDIIDAFHIDEIPEKPVMEFSDFDYKVEKNPTTLPCSLSKGEYAVFECKNNTCGLIDLKYNAGENSKIIIAFDEKLMDGRLRYEGWEVLNVIQVKSSGMTDFSSFEIYGFKYFIVFVVDGNIEIENASVTKIRNPIENPPVLNCDDKMVLEIFEAACETARCNFLGHFMDCPTRERAGWLCDSYFSAQADFVLSGNTNIEDDFVENYVLFDGSFLPEGMLPMCYPADQPDGNYIPQWAMWFIVELEQYVQRNKSVSLESFRELSYKLLRYFEKYENEYGLLENLDGWKFVEWSKANDWVDGINFPTNMLYRKILIIIGNWYDDKALLDKADKLKETIIGMSFDGKFFRDQALRNDENKPVCCEHISEVCQYYAFMFDLIGKEEFPELYTTLTTEFLPDNECYPGIERVNAFMGMYIRLELLSRWGMDEQLVREIKAFFGHMSSLTGTLWEHKHITNSLNHGFAAYLIVLLLKIFNK